MKTRAVTRPALQSVSYGLVSEFSVVAPQLEYPSLMMVFVLMILLLATRKTIPKDVYDSWNSEILIIGSDDEDFSDIESPSAIDVKQDRDDIISINSTSTEPDEGVVQEDKLTSSLFDLKLEELEDSPLQEKGKGKAKAKALITPPRNHSQGRFQINLIIVGLLLTTPHY